MWLANTIIDTHGDWPFLGRGRSKTKIGSIRLVNQLINGTVGFLVLLLGYFGMNSVYGYICCGIGVVLILLVSLSNAKKE